MNIIKMIIAIFIITININAEEQKTITINDKTKFLQIVQEQITENDKLINFKTTIVAKIKIDKNGNFNYEILSESDIEKLNKITIEMLEKKKKIKFPSYKNEDFSTIVQFRNNENSKTTKEQENIIKAEINKKNE